MKTTDYGPRCAPFDFELMKLGRGMTGAEIGVDVGAHAHALLAYCSIGHITLIDPWPNKYMHGYCEGRLMSAGYGAQFTIMPARSIDAAKQFINNSLDFVYIDQVHEGPSVMADLVTWWPKVRPGGLLGYRNYVTDKTPLTLAVDKFIANWGVAHSVLTGEIVLHK